jgi:hypothetical protein
MEGDLYSEQISAGKRTYFLDIKQSTKGNKYLVITESKKVDDGKFERHSVMIFEEDIEKFATSFMKVLLKFHSVELKPDTRE